LTIDDLFVSSIFLSKKVDHSGEVHCCGDLMQMPDHSEGSRSRAPEGTALLELENIRKTYGALVANDGVSLRIAPGEVHAVLGENGAGKSTLMKIIYGVTRPDAGAIRWNSAPVAIDSPATARALGIGMVFQHFTLFETLSVVQNVALCLPKQHSLSETAGRIRSHSERYGISIDPDRLVHSLSVGERQRVEIVRCLLQDPRLIIMDEPTSVLAPQAVDRLFETLRTFASEGRSIVYISHKLDEVRALCDTATVLRAGRVVGSCRPKSTSAAAMASMMIGRDFSPARYQRSAKIGAPALIVRSVSSPADDPFTPGLVDIDLTVRGGEIVGVAGVSGNGQGQFLKLLSGERRAAQATSIEICGVPAGALGPLARRRLGLGFVPEDRLGQGAVPDLPLADNGLLTAHGEGMVRAGLVKRGVARRFAASCSEKFDVRNGRPTSLARSLSGGNLQKFILGRELLQQPKVLIVAQPTWGLDVGAASFVRRRLVEARDAGAAILVVSEELDELFEIADRLVVMSAGRLSASIPVEEADTGRIGQLMGGIATAAVEGLGEGARHAT
jgi:ABC-type uncharacterized transport system ATPase subunit